jgi:hypothetical protein
MVHMTYRELLNRKMELERIRVVLEEHNLEDVYRELGEINYLLVPSNGETRWH